MGYKSTNKKVTAKTKARTATRNKQTYTPGKRSKK
jgi:hypothetical protein